MVGTSFSLAAVSATFIMPSPHGRLRTFCKILKINTMKRIFIGGERPHEAVDITATLNQNVSDSTLEYVVKAANDMWVADETDLVKVLKHAPTSQEIWDGKIKAGLITPVYTPGDGIGSFCEDVPDWTLAGLVNRQQYWTTENITVPQVVAIPAERLRARGDLKSFEDADQKAKEAILVGHTAIMMATNLKLEYILNRIDAVKDHCDFVRVVFLRDHRPSDADVPEEYHGKLILPPLNVRLNQQKWKRCLKPLLFMSNIEDAKDPEDHEWNTVIDRFNGLRKEVRVEIIAL